VALLSKPRWFDVGIMHVSLNVGTADHRSTERRTKGIHGEIGFVGDRNERELKTEEAHKGLLLEAHDMWPKLCR
jgi:hypothetical protein